MEVKILSESGMYPALFGLGLSYGITSGMTGNDFMNDDARIEKLQNIASKLANKDGGHNKFLESMQVWIDINAPRFWWSEFDTYRVGMSKQSESTMHTLKKTQLTQDHFEYQISPSYLEYLNTLINDDCAIPVLKSALPDGFLQRRIVSTNYKVLRNIISQRKNHKLPQWRYFCSIIMDEIKYRCFLCKEGIEK